MDVSQIADLFHSLYRLGDRHTTVFSVRSRETATLAGCTAHLFICTMAVDLGRTQVDVSGSGFECTVSSGCFLKFAQFCLCRMQACAEFDLS